MPHDEIHASGSLDNSGCKRLRISSLVDDMAEEEIQENIFDLFRVGIELLDQMRGCGMDTANWNKMLHRAFDVIKLGVWSSPDGSTCRYKSKSAVCQIRYKTSKTFWDFVSL